MASFWLTRTLFDDPLPVDHALNVALQVGCGLLVAAFLMALRASFPTALLLSALYVVHPVQSEAVSGLVGRCDLLATLFALLALNLALTRNPDSCRPDYRLLAGLFVLSSLSLLSKESAAALFLLVPACLVGRELLQGARMRDAVVATRWISVPLILSVAINLAVRHAILGRVLVDQAVEFAPDAGVIAQRWGALAFSTLYLEKLLWPHPLLPDYATGVIELANPLYHLRATIGLLFVAGSAWLLVVELRRMGRSQAWPKAPALGLLLFWITILPVCNLLITIGTRFGERLLHLPLAFLLLLALDRRLCRRDSNDRLGLRPALLAAVAAVVLISAWMSALRVPAWQSNRELFARAVADAPGNYHSQMSYATTLVEEDRPGDLRRAWDHFTAAALARPQAYEPLAGLGKLALESGDLEQAREYFGRALPRAKPAQRHLALMNLALAHRRLGEISRAEAILTAVVRENPDFGPGRRALGDHWSNRGRIQEALTQYERALESDGSDVRLWQRIIWAHLRLGHEEMAQSLVETCPAGTLTPSFSERLEREGIWLAGLFGS
jgi:Tfp pilus assembly protein PilF